MDKKNRIRYEFDIYGEKERADRDGNEDNNQQ
jgi:hypothetical protein